MKKILIIVLLIFVSCAVSSCAGSAAANKSGGDASISEEEALELVKNLFDEGAFEPLDSENGSLVYRFKNSSYMLQYDNYISDESGEYHLIHEYEIVIDDAQTGAGHTATANWYKVDAKTGEITPMFLEDRTCNENY